MEIVRLIVQQLHAGVISLLPFVPIWLILLNLVTYVIVITVIARQDVDGHFGTTLNLPAGLLNTLLCLPIYTQPN